MADLMVFLYQLFSALQITWPERLALAALSQQIETHLISCSNATGPHPLLLEPLGRTIAMSLRFQLGHRTGSSCVMSIVTAEGVGVAGGGIYLPADGLAIIKNVYWQRQGTGGCRAATGAH
jgi:hypothetical protein